MSERLYYTDAYTTRFAARIVERVKHKKQLAVVLDQSYFYPTSGGQPADQGKINGAPVLDVTIRPEDGAVLHWLGESEVWSDEITAEIDWDQRFDHMQHHTGQHILSQAFIQGAQANTVSFHLSHNSATIDLHTNNLTPIQVEEAELLANDIIWQNRPVRIHMVTPEQARALSLRKIPPLLNGVVRLVDIDRFDLTACGGTHVATTGEIGLLKIVRLERRGEQLRVEFCCGRRALRDYRQKNSIVNRLMADLTTGQGEIVESVGRLREEAKQANRIIKKQQAELAQVEATYLLQNGSRKGNTTVITHVFTECEPAQLQAVANLLAKQAGVVALLGVAGLQARLLFCRAADAPGEMNQLIKPALQTLGSTAGGGSPTFAQGGGVAADKERVRQALVRAERLLLGQIR
jgi:alanyl-tRNA synthetase